MSMYSKLRFWFATASVCFVYTEKSYCTTEFWLNLHTTNVTENLSLVTNLNCKKVDISQLHSTASSQEPNAGLPQAILHNLYHKSYSSGEFHFQLVRPWITQGIDETQNKAALKARCNDKTVQVAAFFFFCISTLFSSLQNRFEYGYWYDIVTMGHCWFGCLGQLASSQLVFYSFSQEVYSESTWR